MSPALPRHLTRDPSRGPHYAEPCGPADEELEWFFTMAESSMGLRSNFEDSLHLQRHRSDRSESHVEAARAHRVILDRLRSMGDPHAGVLQAAYAARAWPIPLLLAFGRLTGVVVRLATAKIGLLGDSHLARVEEDVVRGLLETLYKEGAELAPLREAAATYFDDAYDAYRRKRGRGRSLAWRFR